MLLTITDAHKLEILMWLNIWLGSQQAPRDVDNTFTSHFLYEPSEKWLLYGSDTPQRLYLAVLDAIRFVQKDAKRSPESWSRSLVKKKLYKVIENAEKDWLKIKKSTVTSISNGYILFNDKTINVNMNRNDVRLEKKKFPDKYTERFFDEFNESSWALSKLDNDHIAKGWQKQDKDIRMNIEEAMISHAVRRACKFLIHHAIREEKSIRYVLDNLDLEKVANCDYINLNSRQKVPVCTSELRELFRYWDFYKDYVTFYENFKKVDPPWELSTAKRPEIIQYWADYAAERSKKLLERPNLTTGVRSLLNGCIDTHKQLPSIAIYFYHGSHPSKFTDWSQLYTGRE